MDGRKNNGGHSTKGRAGRPSKTDEQKIIEKLSPIEPEALKMLKSKIKDGEGWAIKLYFEYLWGKPKAQVNLSNDFDINLNQITGMIVT